MKIVVNFLKDSVKSIKLLLGFTDYEKMLDNQNKSYEKIITNPDISPELKKDFMDRGDGNYAETTKKASQSDLVKAATLLGIIGIIGYAICNGIKKALDK